MANFKAHVKSATVNIHKKEVTVSFVMLLNDENMERATELAFYIGKGELTVNTSPRQIQMPLTGSYENLPIEKGE